MDTDNKGHVHMKTETETEIGVMYLQRNTKDCWQIPEARGTRKGFFSRDFRESMDLLRP